MSITTVRAQRGGNARWDVGGGFGVNSYTGDLNLSPLPHSLSGHLFALLRCELTEMYALRFNFGGGGINAYYDPDRYYLPGLQDSEKREFHLPFLNLDANVEIHFLPFQVSAFARSRVNNRFLTPYATFGVGGTYVFNHGGGVYLPFGGGVKIAISSRLTFATEMRFWKTFSDRLDNYKNWPSDTKGVAFHNQDWVSLLSVTCTYRFVFNVPTCPAYLSE